MAEMTGGRQLQNKPGEFEAHLAAMEERNERLSRALYPKSLEVCRQSLLGILHLLQNYRSLATTDHDDSIQERLVVIAAYTQGVTVSDRLVAWGQYIKAAAALKQEIEVVARLQELRAGVAVDGRTPQMRHGPEGGGPVYGMLNNIAHPSRKERLEELVGRYSSGHVDSVVTEPTVIPDVAIALFTVHVSLMRDVAYHQIILSADMNGVEDQEIHDCIDLHEKVQRLMSDEPV